MQRMWQWIVKADDSVGEVTLDAGIAIALAAVVTEVIRSIISLL
jgi:hypothetical protein